MCHLMPGSGPAADLPGFEVQASGAGIPSSYFHVLVWHGKARADPLWQWLPFDTEDAGGSLPNPDLWGPTVNAWLLSAAAVSAALLPCAVMCLSGTPERRLVGLEMTSTLITLVMVLLTLGFGRLPFIDLPLTMAIMSFGGGLVFARFLEKHL